jgi:hypothetical protein
MLCNIEQNMQEFTSRTKATEFVKLCMRDIAAVPQQLAAGPSNPHLGWLLNVVNPHSLASECSPDLQVEHVQTYLLMLSSLIGDVLSSTPPCCAFHDWTILIRLLAKLQVDAAQILPHATKPCNLTETLNAIDTSLEAMALFCRFTTVTTTWPSHCSSPA